MPLVGFEPTISEGERPQTYALDRTATGTGIIFFIYLIYQYKLVCYITTNALHTFMYILYILFD